MEMKHLDVSTIHGAFLTACEAIIINRENLNAINLFPVADGDTGDNMSSTALAIITHSSSKSSLKETLQSLAHSALIGARGNSGMIFSQFFNGLTETELGTEKIDPPTFAQLIAKASASVRSSILNPVEGTIITVIDAWSASINKVVKEFNCFKKMLSATLSEVTLALQSTAITLPVLKDAQVVDSGALGFYHFINGFVEYLNNPREINKARLQVEQTETLHEPPTNGIQPTQRYCTEILLSGTDLNRADIAKNLEQFGDSVVSSGNSNLCRVHVHCKQPSLVFEELMKKGTITQAKAEDMLRQFQIIHQAKYPIALVTDSSADIPQSILDQYQIHIIQLNMHLDEHHLIDRICVNQEKFYNNLPKLKSYPKTSFPSPALIKSQINHLAKHYQEVLVLPIAQSLSGTHDAIVKASEGMNNVHVINSCLTSVGLGFLVSHAAQLIDSGLDINNIKQRLLRKIPKIKVYVYVDQFESLIRSGRISKLSGKIAQFANLKPLITLDELGKAVVFDKAFSELKAWDKIIQHVKTFSPNSVIDNYALVHAGVPDKIQQFAELTSESFNKEPMFIEHVSTALGLHAGKGGMALAVMMQ
jgi:DegV family protein with EDD domain